MAGARSFCAGVAMPAQYGDEDSSAEYADSIPTVSTMLLQGFLWRLKPKSLVTEFNPLALFYYESVIAHRLNNWRLSRSDTASCTDCVAPLRVNNAYSVSTSPDSGVQRISDAWSSSEDSGG